MLSCAAQTINGNATAKGTITIGKTSAPGSTTRNVSETLTTNSAVTTSTVGHRSISESLTTTATVTATKQSGSVTAPNFATRCSDPNVMLCNDLGVDFAHVNASSPLDGSDVDWKNQYTMTKDCTRAPSDGQSCSQNVPVPPSAASDTGALHINFDAAGTPWTKGTGNADTPGPYGNEVYWQWREWEDAAFVGLDTRPAHPGGVAGGNKDFIFGIKNAFGATTGQTYAGGACEDNQIVQVLGSPPLRIHGLYQSCSIDGAGFDNIRATTSNSNNTLFQNAIGCINTVAAGGDYSHCYVPTAGEWSTYQLHLIVGRDYSVKGATTGGNYHYDSTIELWACHEAQPCQLIISAKHKDIISGHDFQTNGIFGQAFWDANGIIPQYGKIWLGPYDTGRAPASLTVLSAVRSGNIATITTNERRNSTFGDSWAVNPAPDTGVAVTVSASSHTVTRSSGTWSGNYVPYEFVKFTGFSTNTNSLYYQIIDVTGGVLTLNDTTTPLQNESATVTAQESQQGYPVIAGIGSGFDTSTTDVATLTCPGSNCTIFTYANTGSNTTVSGAGTVTIPAWLIPAANQNYSSVIVSKRRIPDPQVTTPNAPDNLVVTNNNAGTVTGTWRDNSDVTGSISATGWVVERCNGHWNFTCNIAPGTNFSAISPATQSCTGNICTFTDTSAGASTTLRTYRVKATNASGSSAYTNGAENVPGIPLNLTATAFSSTSIGLTWQAPEPADQTGYTIQRCSGVTPDIHGDIWTICGQSNGNYANVASGSCAGTLAASTVSCTDNTVSASTQYAYRIQASGAAGNFMADGGIKWTNPQYGGPSINSQVTTPSGAAPFAGLPTCAAAGLTVPCWQKLTNTALTFNSSAVCPVNGFGGDQYTFRGSCYKVYAYSGGFPDYVNNRQLLFGGGHGDYDGNEIYSIDLTANPVIRKRITNPDVPSHCWPTSACPPNGVDVPNLEEMPIYPIGLASRDTAGTETYQTVSWPMKFTVGTKVRITNSGTTSMDSTVNEASGSAPVNSGATVSAISSDKKTVTVIKDTPITGAAIAAYSPQSRNTCGASGTLVCYGALTEWSNTVYVGSPNSRHTYNSMAFDPTLNKMVLCGGGLQGGGGTSANCWTLDNLTSMTGDFTTNVPQWTRHFMTATPAGAYIQPANMPCMAYDPNSHLDFYADTFSVFALDFAQNKSTRIMNGSLTGSYHMTCIVDPNLHLFYLMGEFATPYIKVVDIGSCAGGIGNCSTSVALQDWTAASPTCNAFTTGIGPGLAWDTVGNKLVGVLGAQRHGDGKDYVMGSNVYYTAVPDNANHKFVCTLVTASGSTPPEHDGNGIQGNFRYFPGPDVFVVDYAGTMDAWFLRIR